MILFSPAIVGNVVLNLLGGYASSYSVKPFVPKIPLAPPKIVFPVVWSILYVLLGIIAGNIDDEWLLMFYYIHLGLNFLWTPVYFSDMQGKTKLVVGAVIICAMLGIMSYILYKRQDISWYIVPYICWLSFALYLNTYSIFL